MNNDTASDISEKRESWEPAILKRGCPLFKALFQGHNKLSFLERFDPCPLILRLKSNSYQHSFLERLSSSKLSFLERFHVLLFSERNLTPVNILF